MQRDRFATSSAVACCSLTVELCSLSLHLMFGTRYLFYRAVRGCSLRTPFAAKRLYLDRNEGSPRRRARGSRSRRHPDRGEVQPRPFQASPPAPCPPLLYSMSCLGSSIIVRSYREDSLPPPRDRFIYNFRGGVQGAIERAAPTLAAAYAISRAVKIPVMAASGLSAVTAPMALAAGARGVGVGSAGEGLIQQAEISPEYPL